ncbi:MAG: cadherin-like domain-containing protein [Pacificimonas sp.]|jgi:hypothetical protein|nr:cadherin-like domain-containing protein [Pacificimonas sp.]
MIIQPPLNFTAVDLDFDDDNDTLTVQVFQAGDGAFDFRDSAETASDVEIVGFTDDDVITVLNEGTDGVNFSSFGTDITISFVSDGGIANRITIKDVVSETDFVFTQATAEAAVGFNFILTGNEVGGGDNQAPVFGSLPSLETAEDTELAFSLDVTDPDGDPVTIAFSEATGGTVTGEDGSFTFTPAANFSGSASVTATATDGNGGSTEQVLDFTVTPVNDAPEDVTISNDDLAEDAEAGTTVGTLSAVDVEGDTVSFVLTGDANGRFVLSGSNIVVAEGATFDFETESEVSVTVEAADGNGGVTAAVLPITITGEGGGNDGPKTPNLEGVIQVTTSPGQTLGLGADSYRVTGSVGSKETVILAVGTQAQFDASFNSGGDVIVFPNDFGTYTIERLGSTVLVNSSDGTSASIPLGLAGITLAFADGVQEVSFNPVLGELDIAPPVEPPAAPTEDDVEASSRTIFSPGGSSSFGIGTFNVFGSRDQGETTSIGLGTTIRLDPSFNEGQDVILVPGAFAEFTATRSGSTLTLTGESVLSTIFFPFSAGITEFPIATVISLPLGPGPERGTTLRFDDGDRLVYFDASAGEVRFDILSDTTGSVPPGVFGDDTAIDPAGGTFLAGSGDWEGIPVDQLAYI